MSPVINSDIAESIDINTKPPSLKHQAFRGGVWMFGSMIFSNAFLMITLWILARLLSPDDYGLIGILSTYTIIIMHFSELGLGAAIVQKVDLQPIHISTVFWSNLVLGVILCITGVFAAPYIGSFFHSDKLILAFSITSVTIILYSLSVVQRSLLSRSLTFKLLAITEILSAGILTIVASIAASAGAGIFSFVAGILARSLVTLVLLWKLNSWRPERAWNYPAFIEMISFGKWVVITSMVNQLFVNIDIFFVGRVLGPAMLGFYTLAKQLMSYPRSAIIPILTRIAFPVLSKMQQDDEKFRRAYHKMNFMIAFVMFPFFSLLMVVTSNFIVSVFGTKWLPSIEPLRILCIYAILYSISGPTIVVCQAKGRPDLGAKIFVINTIVLALSLVLGV
jgi:O-antigen/teichoic acid export membrane protein